MAEKLKLAILTPEKAVCLGESADSLTVPGLQGEFQILPGHTFFLTELGEGRLTYTSGSDTKSFQISGGFAEVAEDRVTLLAQKIETVA
ncbi:MAG: F0F1 ATP synthase subunit epsilon [Deltaproteobacteria bacterium]|nr:F0F1 ATP synthase subunit epsilon [Deltaproteobacteria bacterium]